MFQIGGNRLREIFTRKRKGGRPGEYYSVLPVIYKKVELLFRQLVPKAWTPRVSFRVYPESIHSKKGAIGPENKPFDFP